MSPVLEAFLSSRGFGELQFDFTQEVVFELVHARRREQDGLVPFRDHHIARANGVSFGFKEVEVLVA